VLNTSGQVSFVERRPPCIRGLPDVGCRRAWPRWDITAAATAEESRLFGLLARLVGLAETEDQAQYGRGAADGQAHECRCGVTSLAVEECEAED